ncbi:hypothetical protein Btru_067989 [Bulinus truncatus]|nr:hypothetical protein Btru_067989 [Bulinus truncatus]
MVNGRLLRKLHKLINLRSTRHLFTKLSFSEPKPLFEESEKAEAAKLVKTALPLLEKSFALLHGSLNPDLRQNALRCRSGLQFLIDEFRDETDTYKDLKSILSCDPVHCIEDYIQSSEDIEPQYIRPATRDLTLIPRHYC